MIRMKVTKPIEREPHLGTYGAGEIHRDAGAKIPGTRREAYKIRAYRFYTRTENLSARMREPEHSAGSPARCGARGLRRTGAGLACWDGRRSLR
jgi:hypothetical protein